MQPELLFHQPPVADPVADRSTPEVVNHILDLSAIKPGDRVLDLGTGNGLLLPYLTERVGSGGSVTGVDFSPVRLSRAMEVALKLTPVPTLAFGNVESDFIPGDYDVVMLYGIYAHLMHKAATLRRIFARNVAHNGGRMIIAFPGDKEFVNSLESDKRWPKDMIPAPADLVASLTRMQFDARVLEDSEQAYVIEIKKS